MQNRNITGTFNNEPGLGTTFEQSQAGVNSWDSALSARVKLDIAHINKYGVTTQPAVRKSPLYSLAFKLGQIFSK